MVNGLFDTRIGVFAETKKMVIYSSPADFNRIVKALRIKKKRIKVRKEFSAGGTIFPEHRVVTLGRGVQLFESKKTRSLMTRPKRKKPQPKPAPPIPRTGLSVRTTSRVTHKVTAKSKKKRKLSAYNLFVQKHRLAGKDMKQIGRLWRKHK